MTAFDKAFERVIGHEGLFQNDPKDRGNWTTGIVGQGQNKGTKYGISAMSYPNEDIKNLTLARAKELYKRDFWDRNNEGSFHSSVQYQMLDAAINHGRGNAARMLQRAVKVADDGFIGNIKWLEKVVDALFFFDYQDTEAGRIRHCELAYYGELAREHISLERVI